MLIYRQMDEELKSYLSAMETRLETRLGARIDESEERMRAHTEMVETRLLNEFWKWARTADAR